MVYKYSALIPKLNLAANVSNNTGKFAYDAYMVYICIKTKKFSHLEIIAHCLYEMTFIGYDKDEIKEQRESFEKTIEEYNNLTEEEKKQKTTSLDELKRRLNEKGSN